VTASAPEPSREAILDFIESERGAGREVGRRDIAKAFGLSAAARSGSSGCSRNSPRMASSPETARTWPCIRAAPCPRVLLSEIKSKDRDGDLVAAPLEWNEAEDGVAPRILIERPREFRTKTAMRPRPVSAIMCCSS
jgi:ribonuclease R